MAQPTRLFRGDSFPVGAPPGEWSATHSRYGWNDHAGGRGRVARAGGAIGAWMEGDCLSLVHLLHPDVVSQAPAKSHKSARSTAGESASQAAAASNPGEWREVVRYKLR
jgi:hypothetical protein